MVTNLLTVFLQKQLPDSLLTRIRARRERTFRFLFGDSLGFLLFLGSLIFFGLYWRIGIFVTDNWTIANTLVAVSDGHLNLGRVVYGPNAYQPGLNVIDGEFYGRNYGQVFFALPFYVALEGLAYLADLRIAIAGGWSLLLLAFVRHLGRVVDKPRRSALIGSGVAILFFALNVVFAIPLQARMRYVAALQLSTMFAAALLGVVTYRLIGAIHERRTGLFVGAVAMLSSPIAFWASLPKRHILVSLLAVLVLFAFYLSRSVDSESKALNTRCLAYVCVALWAWVHAPEALAMLAVLVPFDLATARSNAPRRLAMVVTAFLASLLPFFVTNWLIAGNPLKPPRFLSRTVPEAPIGQASGGGSGAATPGGGSLLDPLLTLLGTALRPVTTLLTIFTDGIEVVITDPSRILYTFIHSAPRTTRATATDLTILETTPILAVLVGVPLLVLLRYRAGTAQVAQSRETAVRQTDAFALVFVLAFTLLYMSRLPLHAMWTVRYLLPIVPFGLYFVGRLQPVRRAIAQAAPTLLYTYSGLVLIGGQLLVVGLIWLNPTLGEVIQFHGLLGQVTAAIAALWVLATSLQLIEDQRISAASLATPLAAGTLFVLLTGLEYFVNGTFALGMSQQLSHAIPLF